MTKALISPSRREVSLMELLRQREKVIMPRFRLETVALRPESLLLIFFLGQMVHIGEGGPRRPDHMACPWARHLSLWLTGGAPPGDSSSSIFIYSKINLHKFLGHLELWRISISVIAFSGPEYPSPSSCETCKIREKRHWNSIIK